MANQKLMSNGQWEADVKWSIKSWFQMANEKLISNGQWAADVKGPMRSWCQNANEISLSQSLYYVDKWKSCLLLSHLLIILILFNLDKAFLLIHFSIQCQMAYNRKKYLFTMMRSKYFRSLLIKNFIKKSRKLLTV